MTALWLLARRIGLRGWAVLAAVGVVLAGWIRWRGMRRRVAAARVELDAAKGERDVARAEVAVVAEVAERKEAAVVVGEDYRAEVAAEIERAPTPPAGVPTAGPNPLDAIRAADRVRAKITKARPRRAGK